MCSSDLIGYAQEVKGMVLINRHIPELAERCIPLAVIKGNTAFGQFWNMTIDKHHTFHLLGIANLTLVITLAVRTTFTINWVTRKAR